MYELFTSVERIFTSANPFLSIQLVFVRSEGRLAAMKYADRTELRIYYKLAFLINETPFPLVSLHLYVWKIRKSLFVCIHELARTNAYSR